MIIERPPGFIKKISRSRYLREDGIALQFYPIPNGWVIEAKGGYVFTHTERRWKKTNDLNQANFDAVSGFKVFYEVEPPKI